MIEEQSEYLKRRLKEAKAIGREKRKALATISKAHQENRESVKYKKKRGGYYLAPNGEKIFTSTKKYATNSGPRVDTSNGLIDVEQQSDGRIRNKRTGYFVNKYTPSIGQRVIDLSSQGFTLAAIAGDLGVGVRTVYSWRDRIPEFAEICDIAKAKRQLFFESKLTASKVNAEIRSAEFALPRMDAENFANPDRNINIKSEETKKINLETMSVDDLVKLREIMSKGGSAKNAAIVDAEFHEVERLTNGTQEY